LGAVVYDIAWCELKIKIILLLLFKIKL